jgi:hypothetical protein
MPRVIPETTLVDVTLADVTSVEIVNITDIEATVFYAVRDDAGNIHHRGDLALPVQGASLQALKSWIDNHYLPAINAQEGMS